jgi:hypothetical protein
MVTYIIADFILDLVVLYITIIFHHFSPINCFHWARRCAPFLLVIHILDMFEVKRHKKKIKESHEDGKPWRARTVG